MDLKTEPNVKVEQIVRAPVGKVWEMFRPFGEEIMNWWPAFEWVKLEDPKEDKEGAVRVFKAKDVNIEMKEKLVTRNDGEFFEQYDLFGESHVPMLKAASTTIKMEALGDDKTKVTWCQWCEAPPLLQHAIKSRLVPTFSAAITGLDTKFNPPVGKLVLKVNQAEDLPGSGMGATPYVSAQVTNGTEVVTGTRWGVFQKTPVWNEALELEVRDPGHSLHLKVLDEKYMRAPELLGEHTLPLADIISGGSIPKQVSAELTTGAEGSQIIKGKLHFELHYVAESGACQVHVGDHHMHSSGLGSVSDMLVKVDEETVKAEEQWEYARYPRFPGFEGVEFEKLPRMVKVMPESELFTKQKENIIKKQIKEYLSHEPSIMLHSIGKSHDPENPNSIYHLLHSTFFPESSNYIPQHWMSDKELCRQFIAGVSPMVIQRLEKLEEVPERMRQLEPGMESLTSLIDRKALFLLDYKRLMPLKPRCEPLGNHPMYFYAPFVLVFKEKQSGELNLAAIQLEREEGAAVYTPDKTPKNRWLLAKLHVSCADAQYHEFIYHLGWAHLAMEPLVISTHNTLPESHPIAVLLKPHFHDTLCINMHARRALMPPWIYPALNDLNFPIGNAQSFQLFLDDYLESDFIKSSFPEQLKSRGFDEERTDELEGYWYREDGFKVWNAIGRYVEAVVKCTYHNDEALRKDTDLQAWAQETADPEKADVRGFPREINTRQELSSVLQRIIWIGSAHHSSVNFSQQEFYSFIPNQPVTLFAPMPVGSEEIDKSVIIDALPKGHVATFQTSFAWTLSTPSEHMLADVDAMKEIYPEVCESFKSDLARIVKEITHRNEALEKQGKPGYTHLLPDRIAASIDI